MATRLNDDFFRLAAYDCQPKRHPEWRAAIAAPIVGENSIDIRLA
jgi:hypothetical protein